MPDDGQQGERHRDRVEQIGHRLGIGAGAAGQHRLLKAVAEERQQDHQVEREQQPTRRFVVHRRNAYGRRLGPKPYPE